MTGGPATWEVRPWQGKATLLRGHRRMAGNASGNGGRASVQFGRLVTARRSVLGLSQEALARPNAYQSRCSCAHRGRPTDEPRGATAALRCALWRTRDRRPATVDRCGAGQLQRSSDAPEASRWKSAEADRPSHRQRQRSPAVATGRRGTGGRDLVCALALADRGGRTGSRDRHGGCDHCHSFLLGSCGSARGQESRTRRDSGCALALGDRDRFDLQRRRPRVGR